MTTHGRGYHMRHSPFKKAAASATLLAQLTALNAKGLWVASDYSASPQPNIRNRMVATPVSGNLFRGGPNQSGRAWATNSITATDKQVGPDGSTLNASRIVGTGNYYYLYGASFPAGTYTVAMEVKSNTGSSQTFNMGFYSSYLAARTATTSWATVSLTMTTVGTQSIMVLPMSPDGTTGCDLLIANLRIFSGSVDLGAEVYAGHMVLGDAPGSRVPVVTGGYMALGATSATAVFPSFTLGPHTVIAIARKNASGSGSGFASIMAKGAASDSSTSPYTDWSSYLEQSGTPTLEVGASNSSAAGMWELFNMGWHGVGQTSDAAGGAFFFDGAQTLTGSTAFAPTLLQNVLFGNLNNLVSYNTTYDFAAYALIPSRLTQAQIGQIMTAMFAEIAPSGITVASARMYVAEGDSITQGSSTGYISYANNFPPNAVPKVIGQKFAIIGSAISTLNSRATLLDATIPTIRGAGSKYILSVLIGKNDLATTYSGPGGTGYAGWLVDLAAYLDARRAVGWKIALGTLLPSTDAGFNTSRNAVNPTLRTWVGTHCDVIMDFAADATIGPDAAASNTTYFVDGVHPTLAGQSLLEPIARAAINSL